MARGKTVPENIGSRLKKKSVVVLFLLGAAIAAGAINYKKFWIEFFSSEYGPEILAAPVYLTGQHLNADLESNGFDLSNERVLNFLSEHTHDTVYLDLVLIRAQIGAPEDEDVNYCLDRSRPELVNGWFPIEGRGLILANIPISIDAVRMSHADGRLSWDCGKIKLTFLDQDTVANEYATGSGGWSLYSVSGLFYIEKRTEGLWAIDYYLSRRPIDTDSERRIRQKTQEILDRDGPFI